MAWIREQVLVLPRRVRGLPNDDESAWTNLRD